MKKVILVIGGRLNAWSAELRWHVPDGSRVYRKRLSGVGPANEVGLTPTQAKVKAALAALDSIKKPGEVEVDIYTDSPMLLEKHSQVVELTMFVLRFPAVTWKDARQQPEIMSTIAELSGYAAAQEIVGAGERKSDDDWLMETMKAHKQRRREAGLE